MGSLASTEHGLTRSTLDSDLVVKLDESHVPQLISRLKNEFYADENMALNAIIQQSGFNLIHLDTMFKVDLFVAKSDQLAQAQLNRRVPRAVSKEDDREIYVASAEDIILAKLKWYRMD